MNNYPHGPPNDWRASQPSSPLNGHTFEIARTLGALEVQASRQIEISLATLRALEALPSKLASQSMAPPPAPPLPQPPPPSQSLLVKLGTVREWVLAAAAIVALAAAVAGKITILEAMEVVTKAAGVP